MAINYCPQCGHELPVGSKRCADCGKVLDDYYTEQNSIVCAECGNSIPISSKECPNCGCPVNSTSKPKSKSGKKAVITICCILGALLVLSAGGFIAYNSEPVRDFVSQVEKDRKALDTSRAAFKDAEKAEADNDYALAINKYQQVIKSDKSYDKAQGKITELQEKQKNKLLAEAENYANDKKYSEAIAKIDEAISLLGQSEELAGLKQKYTDQKALQYVKIEVVNKSEIPMDSSSWIFSNYVTFDFNVTNNSNTAIKGVEGILTINDLFDKKIMSVGCDFTGKTIGVGSNVNFNNMVFECNRFSDEDTKLFATGYSDLKFTYNVTKIVFTDGTTIVPD